MNDAENENQDPIRKHSERLLQLIKDKTGAELEYTMLSLLHLDKILEHLFGKGMSHLPQEGMEDLKKMLRIQIACYYGECIRETFSGVWTRDENLGLSLREIANMDIAIFPLNTANDRLEGEDMKLFISAQFVCSEVFKQMREKVYAEAPVPKPAGAMPPPLPPQ
ncbi:hypothetical protein OKA05_27140 [Luteolibacter arcticus]|uniref:Uncharacterized protein n=1 Tax=Luteolibacter arcticus TaxID=1581411 RepID=A0ABT3GS06_9BACT|nr:hypothetical protein [Luteolibacter arcticus]MCW1926259.1 hypothetical protein [Luteolibacter arcticus]